MELEALEPARARARTTELQSETGGKRGEEYHLIVIGRRDRKLGMPFLFLLITFRHLTVSL